MLRNHIFLSFFRGEGVPAGSAHELAVISFNTLTAELQKKSVLNCWVGGVGWGGGGGGAFNELFSHAATGIISLTGPFSVQCICVTYLCKSLTFLAPTISTTVCLFFPPTT